MDFNWIKLWINVHDLYNEILVQLLPRPLLQVLQVPNPQQNLPLKFKKSLQLLYTMEPMCSQQKDMQNLFSTVPRATQVNLV